jgi:ATP-binding cassette subfamily F protein 3
MVRVFDGTYQDFLDKVGWELDETGPSGERSADGQSPAAVDKKKLRQQRAAIVTERSKIVGPLQQRVQDLETKIVALEGEAGKTTAALESAAIEGDSPAIGELSKMSVRLKQEIDALFDELEGATAELEDANERFKRRLDEIE